MKQNGNWIATDASVYSADYIEPNGEERPFWKVTYSYRVGEEYYRGSLLTLHRMQMSRITKTT